MIGLFIAVYIVQVIGMFFIIASHGGDPEIIRSMTGRVAMWLAFINLALYNRFAKEEEERQEKKRRRPYTPEPTKR